MDEKRSSSRSKRQKPIDEGCWDCSVCTFKNPPEAYKCEMCDVRKGTSTRKPRLNAQIAAQQVAQQYVPPPPKKEKGGPTLRLDSNGLASMNGNESSNDSFDCHMNGVLETNNIVKKEKNHTNASKKNSRSPRLKDIDRSSATHMAVTVGSVTVVITDYKPKKERRTSTETHSNVVSDSSDTSSHGLLHSNDNELVMDNGNQ